MKFAINLALLFLFGLVLGWFAQQQLEERAGPQTHLTTEVASAPAVNPPTNQNLTPTQQPNTKSEELLTTVDPETDWLEGIDINSKGQKPELNSAARILAYLSYAHEQQADYHALREGGLRNFLRGNPQLVRELLGKLLDIENDKVRNSLGSILEILNMQQQPLLELEIMEHIKAGENASAWLNVLGNWGLQSRSSMGYLYNQLASYPAAQDQANIIRAISGSSWVKNSALQPNDRSRLQALIEPHFRSEDVALRAAAFASLRTLPISDTTSTLLAGLRDQSPQVRREALTYISLQKPKEKVLNQQLMAMANDTSLSLSERSSMAYLLSQASNPEQDQREQASKLFDLITAQIEALPEQERQAIYVQPPSY